MPAMTGPRLAVFDCDGTLVDSQHAIAACMAAAFEAERLAAPAPAAVRRVIGLPLPSCVAILAPEADEGGRARLVEAYKETFFTIRQRPDHHEPMFDGAREALDALEAEGWLLAVATGKARRGLLAVLERHALAGRFVSLQTADDGPGKPDPGMILRAMDAAGAAPADTVMIGDTSFDMRMAANAGVPGLAVGWGYHPADELRAAGAAALAERFDEIPGLAGRLARRETCAS
jgi:phosphoglycolate phosphatase